MADKLDEFAISYQQGTLERRAEASKRPSWLSFGGAGRAKVPCLK